MTQTTPHTSTNIPEMISKVGPTTGITAGVLAIIWVLQGNVDKNTDALTEISRSLPAIEAQLENVQDDLNDLEQELSNYQSGQASQLRELEGRVRDLEISASGG